jgi:hypothetical protein
MNMYKEIWIDIRDEHELAESQIISPNDETLVIICQCGLDKINGSERGQGNAYL